MDRTRVMGIDFETYSAAPLPAVGLKHYVEDPTFMPTLLSVATKYGTTHIEFPADKPDAVRAILQPSDSPILVAHNAGFERAVLLSMGIDVPIHDSAVVAAVAGADRHLAGAARQLLNMEKLDEDRSLLRLFAMPSEKQIEDGDLEFDRALPAKHPDKWTQFIEYCDRDAELSREIYLNWHGDDELHDREMEYARLTLAMNEAGWPVDMLSVGLMLDQYHQNLDAIQDKFADEVDPDLNLASHDQVKKWCKERGVTSASFDKQHVEKILRRLEKRQHTKGLSDGELEVQRMLRTKQALGGSSLKKLQTIKDLTYQGRLYDQYYHAGAPQSLRTTGRGVQMQNLPRLPATPKNMNDLHTGRHWTNDEIGENLRQVFRASNGLGLLFVADFASIESRALAYLAGEDWKLEAYRRGEDIYKAQAMKIFNLATPDVVTKEQRTTGKVGELSCGYGAGGGAVQDFAEKMHVELTEAEANGLVSDWRSANPDIVRLWGRLDAALKQVVLTKRSEDVTVGPGLILRFRTSQTPLSLIDLDAKVQTIRMDLLDTYGAELHMSRVFHGCHIRSNGNIGYWKPSSLKGGPAWKRQYVDPKTKRQRYYELYGGKIAGILTQSFCREIFFEVLNRLDTRLKIETGATIVGQFHDECIVEWTPGGSISEAALGSTMEITMNHSTNFPDLPMAVEVKSASRYIK